LYEVQASFPGEWQKAYGLGYPTLSSAWLRMCTSEPPIPLNACTNYYSMKFNIDYDDDNYYYGKR
jgi:hypothetical protein